MTTSPPPSLTVRVAPFEYGCCRTPPEVGATISGTLVAHPTSDHQTPVRVTGWDRRRDLVVVHGGLAPWDPSYGDPFEQPVGIWLSWHCDGVPGVHVTATVDKLSQVYLGSPDDPTTGETIVPTERVDKFPEPLLTLAGVCEAGGAVVTLADPLLIAPTVGQVADFRMQQVRARRTIHITAPPRRFGLTIPGVGDRITVDLDDPTTTVSNRPSAASGIVTGIATQVAKPFPTEGSDSSVSPPISTPRPAPPPPISTETSSWSSCSMSRYDPTVAPSSHT